jgi:hypothetical protein
MHAIRATFLLVPKLQLGTHNLPPNSAWRQIYPLYHQLLSIGELYRKTGARWEPVVRIAGGRVHLVPKLQLGDAYSYAKLRLATDMSSISLAETKQSLAKKWVPKPSLGTR